MAADPQVLRIAGEGYIVTPDMLALTLSESMGSTFAALDAAETGGDYVVPTGKIFRILLVHCAVANTSARQGEVDISTTANVAGTRILNLALPANGINNVYTTHVDVPANNYINARCPTGHTMTISVLGIEMNA